MGAALAAGRGIESAHAQDSARAPFSKVFDFPSDLFEARQSPAQVNHVIGKRGEQRVPEVRPIYTKVGRAEQTLRHRQLAHDASGAPLAIRVRVWLKRYASQALLTPIRRKTCIEFGII